jgi:hypothetical protein
MTDQETVDSPVEGLENLEVPLPEVTSDPSAGEPSSAAQGLTFDQATLDSLAEAVVKIATPKLREGLRPEVESAVQSSKDRRFKKLEDLDPEDIRLVAEALKKAGDDPLKAAEDLGVQALLEERRMRSKEAQTAVTQTAPAEPEDKGMSEEQRKAQVRAILADSGLSPEEMKAVLKDWGEASYTSIEASLNGLAVLAIKQARESSEAPPSGAGSVLPAGGSPITVDETERVATAASLYDELEVLMRAPSENMAAIEATKEKLRKLGEENI